MARQPQAVFDTLKEAEAAHAAGKWTNPRFVYVCTDAHRGVCYVVAENAGRALAHAARTFGLKARLAGATSRSSRPLAEQVAEMTQEEVVELWRQIEANLPESLKNLHKRK